MSEKTLSRYNIWVNDFFYKVNEQEYPVHIIHKKMKNIHFRFKEDHFEVSCPRMVLKSQIIHGLDKFGETLIKKSVKPISKNDEFIYLFGSIVNLENSGEIKFSSGLVIKYNNHLDLDKKLHKMFLEILKKRVAYYSNLMSLPLYKVSLKNMKTRFGSNSKHTKTLHFAYVLIHYSYDIIDSVIVHELAHIVEYNHSKKFYDVVYKYCPNYKIYRKKLIRGEFS